MSGFLITYLFLAEHEKTGTINWKNFQIRRALRLWPVYYITTAITFFALPHFIDIESYNEQLEKNLYAYHTMSIAIVIIMLKSAGLFATPILRNVTLYTGSFLLTLGLSALSYRFFERFSLA